MKKLLFIFLLTTISFSQNWKVVKNKYLPISPSAGINLRSGFYGSSGLILGYDNGSDSGTIRYNNQFIQYFNGSSWITVATSSGGSVGDADSLGGIPASDYARLSISNTFTATPQIFSATRQDTISSKTPSGNVVVNDSAKVNGTLQVTGSGTFAGLTSTLLNAFDSVQVTGGGRFGTSTKYAERFAFENTVSNLFFAWYNSRQQRIARIDTAASGSTNIPRLVLGDSVFIRGSNSRTNTLGGIGINISSNEIFDAIANQNSQALIRLTNQTSGTGAQSALVLANNNGNGVVAQILSSGFSNSYQKNLGVLSNQVGGLQIRGFTGYPVDIGIGSASLTYDFTFRVTKNGYIAIGDTTEGTTRLTVTNKLLPKIQMWRNQNKDTLAYVDSSGYGLFKNYGSATIPTTTDTVSVYIFGLTTATGQSVVSYNSSTFFTPDTIPMSWVPSNDTLRIRGKKNKVVNYWIGRK